MLPWFEGPVNGAETDAVEALIDLWVEDSDLAMRVVALPWVSDGVDIPERDVLRGLADMATIDPEVAGSVAAFPWVGDDMTEVARIALSQFPALLSVDIELAKDVAALPWLHDEMTKAEKDTLYAIYKLADADLELANVIMIVSWLRDDITEVEGHALRSLAFLASENVAYARQVAGLTWFIDNVRSHEMEALRRLYALTVTNNDLAGRAMAIPWFSDELTEFESNALDGLSSIASEDLEYARRIMTFHWFVDNVTQNERDTLWSLGGILSRDKEFAEEVANFSWLIDGVTENESDVLLSLLVLIERDAELAEEMVVLPGLIDGVTQYERDALAAFRSMNLGFAKEVVALKWFIDGVTESESRAIYSLHNIAFKNLPFAKRVINLPRFSDGIQSDLESHLLRGLRRTNQYILRLLMSQTWFADGLDDEEAAFMAAFTYPMTEELHEEMLEAHYIQHQTVSLPLAGPVNIWVIQNVPPVPGQTILKDVEDVVRIAEDFLGAAFPTSDVILLVVFGVGEKYEIQTSHRGYMVASEGFDKVALSIPHVIVPYYFSGRYLDAEWLEWGGASFVETYVHHQRGDQDLVDRRERLSRSVQTYCVEQGVENIRHSMYFWEQAYALRRESHVLSEQLSASELCNYILGENFLLSLLETIGEEALSSALRETFLFDRGHLSAIGDERPVSEEEMIYQTFMKHAPPQHRDEVRDLYQKLHGGAFAFPNDYFTDGHGDKAPDAAQIEVGEVVEGALDHLFDFDYFRFQAEKGQKYRFNVNNETLHHVGVTLFAPDGLTEERDNWKSRSMGPDGPQILWTAPSTGEYYVAVRNFGVRVFRDNGEGYPSDAQASGGSIGPYTLTITVADDPEDDHGDMLASATELSLGEEEQGTVDDDFDYDYFRFQAREGQGYQLFIRGESLELFCLKMYNADGTELIHWPAPHWSGSCDQDKAWKDSTWKKSDSLYEIHWVPKRSGEFYLSVYGYNDHVGEYNLKMIEVFSREEWFLVTLFLRGKRPPASTCCERHERHARRRLNRADGTLISDSFNHCNEVEQSNFAEEYGTQIGAPETGEYYLGLYGLMENTGGYKFEIEIVN